MKDCESRTEQVQILDTVTFSQPLKSTQRVDPSFSCTVGMETSDVIVTIQLTTVAMTVVMTLVRSQSVPIHDHILQEMHTMKVDG